MKEFVEPCFTSFESVKDKDQTEKLLKEVRQVWLKDGSAYTIDWNHEPLPGLTREHVAKRPKKKQLEAFSSFHPPRGSDSVTPGAEGAG
ncbi:Leukocyte receptor cluster member 8 [Lemmus lemmus]